MKPFFEDYLERLGESHEDCKAAIEGLSQDALDWKPGSGMNSIGGLISHLIGAEQYWIGDFLMKEPSGRNRDQEFQTTGLDARELSRRLDKGFAYIQKSLGTLTIQDLEEIRVSPRDGQEFNVGWALLHIMKHTALHLGHVDITRQMWHLKS